MSKIWSVLPSPEEELVVKLQSELSIPYDFAKILIQRGLFSFEDARLFFRPEWSTNYDPFLMKDMERAVERIKKAIENREKILLFGDYDVDGTTAVATMWNVLTSYYESVIYYIPDRYKEGYGVSTEGIDFAKSEDVGLIISLDCGIRSIDKVVYAKELGIDFIICDHHQPGEELPDAIVLDPQRKDCLYPYKGLSGCGVGFKLLQGLQVTLGWKEEVLLQQLDLVAISIGADIVPITDENRVFCYHGLAQLNANPRVGVKVLVALAKKDFPLLLTDVVFTLAPRINAAGRINSGMKAVELMISSDEKLIQNIAASIDQDNLERRELDAQITFEALQQIAEDTTFITKNTTVVFQEDWHKGVIGIVASRLIETHYRPTIVLTESHGKLTGSARSIKGLDIHEALNRCSDLLEQYGGHSFAAGMTLHPMNLEAFRSRFDRVVLELMEEETQIEQVEIDAIISFDTIFQEEERSDQIPKFSRLISQMEPFGPGNRKPVFLTKNVSVCSVSLLKGEHIKAELMEGLQRRKINAIGFRMEEFYSLMLSGKQVDIVYTIESNTWNNKSTVQLNLKDIRESLT